jgi:predicted DCC family thiol-disulfide oxidoreductase YuxK
MAAAMTDTRGILIFDGDCGFCTTAVRWLDRVLPAFPSAVPYQWTDLNGYGLSTQDAHERVWYVTATRQYGGHLALAAILRHQPTAALRGLGWLAIAPPWSWAAAAGYALVARFRYLLPGGTPACRVTS